MVPLSTQDAKVVKGFTLVELLVVIAIIGVLSAVGTVSYDYVRVKARDAKRVSDIETLRNAVELYYAFMNSYPPAPAAGIALGSPDAKSLSSAGFTPAEQEKDPVFLTNVPSNIEPGGETYLYHARNPDGSDCTQGCSGYTITFALEENVGSFKSGPHRLTESTLEGPEGNTDTIVAPTLAQQLTPTSQDWQFAYGAVQETGAAVGQVTARPDVQVASFAALPVSFAALLAGIVSAFASVAPIASAGQVFVLFFSQPLLILGRRKRETWGTVYHSGKKTPIDLASVRLLDARTGRLVSTKITDGNGRYAFTPPQGTYRIEVSKPGFTFPSVSLSGARDDGKFVDIYHGTLIEVGMTGQIITVNIPLDSLEDTAVDALMLARIESRKRLKRLLAASGPIISLLVLVVRPSLPMALLFVLQILLYAFFKRIAEAPQPKSQGVIYDAETRDPVDKAVVRILSLPYHRVLETCLTDAQGRYHFYVGAGRYELVILKPGYDKTETNEIDLTKTDKPSFIAADLPLRLSKPAA